MKLVIKWLIFALVIMGTCYIPGISIDSFWYAIPIAAVITLLSIFVKPVLKFVAMPINMLTLGFFNLIINMCILYAASDFIPQYKISSILSGFIASIIIAIAFGIIKRA